MLISPSPRDGLLIALGATAVAFTALFVRAIKARANAGTVVRPRASSQIIGFVATFLDTLGIGNFATTTSMFRQWHLVPDEQIPGTLNIGYALPTIVQAFIYTRIVPVGAKTLILMIAASVVGAWLGASVVSRWPRRRVQVGMGIALLAAATIMVLSQPQVHLIPAGGDALELSGPKLAVGVAGNFVLGSLMTLGIGLYAPCMILVYLLGMTPTAAFPIMMGSCAFLMPIASVRFLKAGRYAPSAALGMLMGIPAVFVAAFIVKSLPLTMVRWLVVLVVTYTAISLLRAARASKRAEEPALPSIARAEI